MADLVAEGRRRLARALAPPSDAPPLSEPPLSPGREASGLLGHVLGWTEVRVLTGDREPVSPGDAHRYRALLARREAREPYAYLVGEREFWGRPFRVDRRVLIPRPETEHLVETALTLDLPEDARVLDVGTGSGAIGVTLALERPRWRVAAVDLSPGALAVARRNAHHLGARLGLAGGDLASPLRLETFDLVVSNPPYIGREEAPALAPEVRDHEPALALFADDAGHRAERGSDLASEIPGQPGRSPAPEPSAEGTGTIARLLDAARRLRPGAHLLFETGHRQRPWIEQRVAREREARWQLEPAIHDYGGIPRIVLLKRLG